MLRFNLLPFLCTLLGILNGSVVSFCSAFTTSSPVILKRNSLVPLKALPTSLLTEAQSSFLTIAASEDIPLEEAFQDSISLTDGPVGVLLAAFGVFVVLAVGFKAVMGQMDDAIAKVLVDFESTLKAYYPKRWRVIEEMELKGLTGDQRDIKLLQVMERLQQEEPEFMTQVANRGVPGSSVVVDAEIEKSD